ncbi:uncharacterized protein [Mobula birostris]|uniref:uncharacterized protein isoform X2 n=1 Tax=Mobula birostris TaxID=1983395 RepID=UPI003B27B754
MSTFQMERDESHKEDQSDAEDSDGPGHPESREENNVSSDSESEKNKNVCNIEQSDDEAGNDKENHFTNEGSGGEPEGSHNQLNDTDSEKDGRMSPVQHESRGASDNDSPGPLTASKSDDEQENKKTVKRKKPVLPDSEDEKEVQNNSAKKTRLMSDSEDSDSDVAPTKNTVIDSDREESDSESGDTKRKQAVSGSQESDSEADVAPVKRIISDDDSDSSVNTSKAKHVASDDDSGSDSNMRVKKQVVSDAEDSDSNVGVRKKRVFSDGDGSESDSAPKEKRIVSDDEDSNSDSDTGAKKKRILSAGEDSDSDAAPGKESKAMLSDSDEENKQPAQKAESGLFGSDSESEDETGVGNLIADIFGESDDEGEEFTGFNQEDLDGEKAAQEAERKKIVAEESDSDNEVRGKGLDSDFVSDFEMMLQKKKDQNRRRRRNRDGGTFISDADDVVSAMITKMNEAAEEDRQLNGQKKPALKKLTLLPTVVMHLKKQDLKDTFIDSGVMSAIKEWLTPLPDKSLPHLKIREELLKILQELPSVSQETLKHSGIGRCVMYLYKHPKENRSNKELAGKLINEWSRPIFGLTSNYKGMTREEREQRDIDQMPMRRRLSSSGGQTPRRDLEKVLTGEEKALRPGDPGFCARARVPLPSNRDYVVRPKWNVEIEASRGAVKKTLNRLDKQMRRFQDIKKMTKSSRAVKISIEGNRMPL